MRQFYLLLAFSTLMLLEAYGFSDTTDKKALLEFKSKVSQEKRVVLSSWNSSFPLCNWVGVTCGRRHKRVTGLDLRGLRLGGVISPSIGNLSFLISLNLTDNSFVGTIPQQVGNLFRLKHLFMESNFLTGEIPVNLFNCSRLLSLHLDSNNLEGNVPWELGSLKKLVSLDLGRNDLRGKIPNSLGNLTSLQEISVGENNIEGLVPDEIARLTRITTLEISANRFSGGFPPVLYNMSSLEKLNIFGNSFSGRLRDDLGTLLPNLRELYVGNNHFIGTIPKTLPNISTLQGLGMDDNNFTGVIPPSFGILRNLQALTLHSNSFGSYSFGDLEFLGALTNCTKLKSLSFSRNRLGGDLPSSVANLSTELISLLLGNNVISGSIPNDIGNLVSLQTLRMERNILRGKLPTSLGKLSSLGSLSLHSNRISGEIPPSIGNITQLLKLFLFNNSLEGFVPQSLGNCRYLLNAQMGSNKLNGTIPREITKLRSLVTLSFQRNSLTGSLPKDVGGLEHLVTLSVAHNKLSGKLPQTLGKCLSMERLYLQENAFDGVIPDLSALRGVRNLDLSSNKLFGSVPGYLANFSKLQDLNLSVNNFNGKVPTEGIFRNVTIVSVFGNKNLCGGIKELKLKPCFPQQPPRRSKHSSRLKVVVGVVTALLLLFFIAVGSLCWFLRKRKNNHRTNNLSTPSTLEVFHEKISYGELRDATNGFSSINMIGSGSFGTVFKALLPTENKIVAVKVLDMQRRGAMKSFMAECESLKDIRHRNLVKVLTACSSIDYQGTPFRALVYEFMPNGSLDIWLHPEEIEEFYRPSRTLTLLEMLNIVIDVAFGLEYLHVHCHEPVAHCDLKPTNILLDDCLTARISDFGLARLLLKFDQESFLNQLSSTGVRGTIGYAAPEYGMGGQPSIHGDVYSFGILVLEMFTGRRPTNELFGGNFTLNNYVKSAMPEQVLDIANQSILQTGLRVGFPAAECLKVVLEVGLRCCEESPTNRLAMSESVKELISTKERFF